MSCKTAYLGGWGTCKNLLKKMSGGVIQTKGQTWTDSTIIASSSWHTAIADDNSSVRSALPLSILNFENTTDEATITTTPLGHKFKDGDPIPSGILSLKCGLDDYLWLMDHDGQEYEFFPFFQGNQFWGTRKADGTIKGFRCLIHTVAGLPPEDKLKSYPLYIFFDDPEEFKEIVVVSPDNWRFSDLVNYVPVGIKFRVTTAYSSGSATVYCEKVGSGDPMTGLSTTTDWEIMTNNPNTTPTVAVTVVSEVGQGYYTLTIKKDNDGTPANLTATDWVIIQAHDDDGTYLTYLSAAVQIYGGT